jgi:hypothetical protein
MSPTLNPGMPNTIMFDSKLITWAAIVLVFLVAISFKLIKLPDLKTKVPVPIVFPIPPNDGNPPQADAEDMATTLYKSMKRPGTNEKKIFGVFSRMKTKTQLNQVSQKYFNKYGQSLAYDLEKELSNKDRARLRSLIDALE